MVVNGDLQQFCKLLKRAIRAHNAARSHAKTGPRTKLGHFINENTLVRVDEALEAVRMSRLDAGDNEARQWDQMVDVEGFDAYVTMRVYRNSIIHHNGTLNEEFYDRRCTHGGLCKATHCGRRKQYLGNYNRFCKKVKVRPRRPGQRLKLPATKPDFLQTLIQDVRAFAQNVLTQSG